MKTKIVQLLIVVFKAILKCIYSVLKLLPVKENKILFCSRQSNDIPLDFRLLKEELDRRDSCMEYAVICRNIGHGLKDYMIFFNLLLKSMYHLATSRICVLDSYWPAVSLLNHKRELTVIQIWHAIGKIKKSGHASVGTKSGRSGAYARMLNMHENYDYIIAGAAEWNEYYCGSFNVSEERLLNYGLPRIDYLINTEDDNRKRFFGENPQFEGKKIILYAPTFRRNLESKWDKIIDGVDYNKYVLIIKNHPSQRIYGPKPVEKVYYFDDWKTMDLIAVCDYIITDYSAIALEAAVLNKKTYYWVYDYEEYLEHNGLNIDLYEAAHGHVFKNLNDLMKSIDEDDYDMEILKEYRKRYLPEHLGTSTDRICDLIIMSLKKGKR